VLGGLTAIPSIWFAASQGLKAIAWIDGIAFAWVFTIWRAHALPYRFRAWNLLALIYLLGVWFLLTVGPASEIYLMGFPVMAALLLGLRPGLLAITVNAFTLLGIGYLAKADLHVPGFEAHPFLEWVIITLNFVFINSVITISCAVLLNRLEFSLERQRAISLSLEEEQTNLRKANEELTRTGLALNRMAYFDALTGLPNRRLLLDRLGHALSSARRTPATGALLYLDLDRFKNINDARGHACGDELLVSVAKRLSGLLREEDTVARLGGDEFVILTTHLTQEPDAGARAAMAIASKVREALEQPFIIGGQPYNVSGSVGVTLLPRGDGPSAEDLLREADTAMYRAKADGRNRIAFFETAMQSEVEERLSLEHDLSLALNQIQLALHIQGQVNPAGQTVGGELLLRWTHPLRGQVSPAHFIPIAEESSLMLRLGSWVMTQAFRTQVRLQAAGRRLPLSINVSPRQFHQPDFVQQVSALLESTGADPTCLILEVTEGLLIEHLDSTIARMNEIAALGIRFSIDDFGTGYSSLAYLKRLPLYEIKIDRSFIQDTPADPSDTAIVQLILSMARHMGLRVVAEGVETREQADFLCAHGCDVMQGFLFARPVSVDDWLAREGL
jgi:diguanylate cyclase (GGDEF)-like protein